MMGLTAGQERCVKTLDRAIVVAAGAGSGKTFTLTERIVEAFREGYIQDIGQVMAITYTRKAAGELKSRVKAALRANGMVDQALKVDGAWISTIHGMCRRILRAHALELGLDPAFASAEDPDLAWMITQAVDAALVRARLDHPEQTAALFREYPANSRGRGTSSIEGMLDAMVGAASANPLGADAFVLPESRVNPLFILEHVAATLEEVRDAASRQKPGKSRDAWLDASERTCDAIQSALGDGDIDAVGALRLVATVETSKRFGDAEYKAIVDDARAALTGCVVSLRLHAANAHLHTLAAIARDASERFARAKREAGILDNDDLLVLASKALDENPRIAECYADTFKLIMVDEFQDTDQLQVDMVKRLAGPDAARLCTVGDAQQSIYRFRGADVSVYRRHLASVQAGDPESIIELHENFRSHGDILAYVRHIFERPEMFGGSFMNLERGRDEDKVKRPFEGFGPRIIIQHTCAPHSGAVPQACLQTAARRIALHFAQLKKQGYPASDMVLLLGAMTHAGVYAQAFRDVGLPCVITGGTVFPSSAEAKAVLDAVRVLADPHDTRALYRLLAGPMFALTEEDLLFLATSPGQNGAPRRRALDAGLLSLVQDVAMDSADAGHAGVCSERVACAARTIGDALRQIAAMPVTQLVRRMVVESGWLSRFEGKGPEGLAGAGNALKALRFLDDAERLGGMGPAQLASRFEEMLESMKEGPGALSAGEGDFVRIMTVHSSKGLEFPVVALADLGDGGTVGKFMIEDVGGRIYASLDLGQTGADIGGAANPKGEDVLAALASLFDEGADEDDLAAALAAGGDALTQRAALALRASIGGTEERKRLLYVALTRAKEALIVSLRGTYSGKNPLGLADSVLAQTAFALGYADGGTSVVRASYEYGGSAPAILERVSLEPGQTAEEALGASSFENEDEGQDTEALVALPDERIGIARDPYRPVRLGVFSYSSIAEASHRDGMLEDLAGAYTVEAGGVEGEPAGAGVSSDDADAADVSGAAGAFTDYDDAFWDEASWEAPIPFAAGSADSDKATDLGTAFHRLAQYAVNMRAAGDPLAMPPDERIQALARTCGLGADARRRLDDALTRWFASDEAALVADFDDVRAEVPFYVRIQPDAEASAVFLEGEIDLLALSEGGRCAHVVDYKTGGSDSETSSELASKHVLQATCYAYALMRSGIEEVDAVFVRVERPEPASPEQPQTVRYHFCVADEAALESAIVHAYQLGQL